MIKEYKQIVKSQSKPRIESHKVSMKS